jgi:hypothetical protein
MDTEIFCLCDYAQEMGGGKIVIVGTFDTIFAQKMPSKHATCSIVTRIRFVPTEVGRHTFQVAITDPGGSEVIPSFRGDFNVNILSGNDSSIANFVMNIGGLELKTFGTYSITLRIDGTTAKSIPLFVKPTQ